MDSIWRPQEGAKLRSNFRKFTPLFICKRRVAIEFESPDFPEDQGKAAHRHPQELLLTLGEVGGVAARCEGQTCKRLETNVVPIRLILLCDRSSRCSFGKCSRPSIRASWLPERRRFTSRRQSARAVPIPRRLAPSSLKDWTTSTSYSPAAFLIASRESIGYKNPTYCSAIKPDF